MKKRALISVSDKTDLIDFAKVLVECNFEIISTGGTKMYLEEAGVEVIGIEEVTGFPEILDGRVKTLHPKVHGGLLSIRDNDCHLQQLEDNQIDLIDMVVVNLYPFSEVIDKEDCSFENAIENIDIGGPSMLRSAAKNYKYVTAICDKSDYALVGEQLKEYGEVTEQFKLLLCAKVFRHTAKYDTIIANYLTNDEEVESFTLTYDLHSNLRYGENPHQKANFYLSKYQPYSVAHAYKIQGKQLSYNNIQDSNAALNIVKEFSEPVVVALKHMNPCGVGTANDIYTAYEKAYDGDPISIFGGIVALNREVDEKLAIKLNSIFLEIIIAPSFSPAALEIFNSKQNLRLLQVDMNSAITNKIITSVNGGILVQDEDNSKLVDYKCVTKECIDEAVVDDLKFGWKVCKHVKSNAIVVVKNGQTLGIGAGQMSRVGAAKIALSSAKEKGGKDLVLASDAFFPFDDAIELAHEFGVKTIVQPGGSINDQKVIDKCDEYGIAMIFTNIRNFKH